MTTSVENSLPAFSKRVAKLSLQLHLTIDLPFSTVELCFTVTLGQAKSLPVAISTFHVVCTVIILIMALIFLIIQFFIFSAWSIKIVGRSAEKQQINLEWPKLCTQKKQTTMVEAHGHIPRLSKHAYCKQWKTGQSLETRLEQRYIRTCTQNCDQTDCVKLLHLTITL